LIGLSAMVRFALILASGVLLCALLVPAPAFAQAGKRCRSVAGISRLEIGPKKRPCSVGRSVARAWKRKSKCDPSGYAQRNCKLRLSRPWGCEAQAFEFDPD
jgi:hypothetical protein